MEVQLRKSLFHKYPTQEDQDDDEHFILNNHQDLIKSLNFTEFICSSVV